MLEHLHVHFWDELRVSAGSGECKKDCVSHLILIILNMNIFKFISLLRGFGVLG